MFSGTCTWFQACNIYNNGESYDWDKTQQLAHKIKGGAVYVGTMKIKMDFQYLERYWKSGQSEFLEPLYQQAVDIIEESMPEIRRWLKAR